MSGRGRHARRDRHLDAAGRLLALPAVRLKTHPRNKSDDELRYIVDKGGFVGVTMFPPFLAKGIDSTIDD